MLSPVKQLQMAECVLQAGAWSLPGGKWLILSIIVKVITKERHLHSHSSKRNMRSCHLHTDVDGGPWGYLTTLKVQGLFILSRSHFCFSSLSFICLFKDWENAFFLRCAVVHNKSAYESKKGREWQDKESSVNDATRQWDRVGRLFLVFRVEKNQLLNVSFI